MERSIKGEKALGWGGAVRERKEGETESKGTQRFRESRKRSN